MATDIYGLTNSAIASNAAIRASKLEGEHAFDYSQTGTIAADSKYFGMIQGAAGTLLSMEASIVETIATGGDRTVTLDLLKSTGAGAYASVLSSTLQFTNGSTLRADSAATISTTSCVAGDKFKLTVAVAGAAGNQALGLCVTIRYREDAP